MSELINGGLVHPITITADEYERGLYGEYIPNGRKGYYPGMTLRDHFAGLAMPMLMPVDESMAVHRETALQTARLAYTYADAMLKARGETITEPTNTDEQ